MLQLVSLLSAVFSGGARRRLAPLWGRPLTVALPFGSCCGICSCLPPGRFAKLNMTVSFDLSPLSLLSSRCLQRTPEHVHCFCYFYGPHHPRRTPESRLASPRGTPPPVRRHPQSISLVAASCNLDLNMMLHAHCPRTGRGYSV